jgi:hexulose-6-phosphate isomerase
MDTLRRLAIAADAGYDGVEVNLEPWEEFSLASSEGELAALRQAIEAQGLRVSAVYDREQWHYPMSSQKPATREHCRAIIAGLIRAASILGTDTVLIMPGGVDNSVLAPEPEIVPYAVAYQNAQAVLRDLAVQECERYGVCLAVENCPNKFLLSPLEFARFLDEINSSRVKAFFDVGNVMPYGFPDDWISILGHRIQGVHFKDMRLSAGYGTCATPLLAGDVDWPAVQEALARLGYDAWVTAEVFPPYRYHGERLIYETSASIDTILGLARF